MPKNDFWDLTYRPYTQLKLKILEEYLKIWAKIFFSIANKKKWAMYQKIYYIDCFAGRGKYHKGGRRDIIDGSPLIALKCASEFQQKYKGVKMDCLFVEKSQGVSRDLKKFCKPYEKEVNFKIYEKRDLNGVVDKIVKTVEFHPSFFFIDPDGIKELKKISIEKIVNHNGPTDILLNYIKGGVERSIGIAKKNLNEVLDPKTILKNLKTIQTLTEFSGLDVLGKLDKSESERLKEWVGSVLKSGNLKEVAVFAMPYLHKSDNIYYLLFASKKKMAKNIILHIFKNAKKRTYTGQITLDLFGKKDFEL